MKIYEEASIEPEKGHLQKTTGNIMLSGEGPNSFPLNSERRKDLKKPQILILMHTPDGEGSTQTFHLGVFQDRSPCLYTQSDQNTFETCETVTHVF